MFVKKKLYYLVKNKGNFSRNFLNKKKRISEKFENLFVMATF